MRVKTRVKHKSVVNYALCAISQKEAPVSVPPQVTLGCPDCRVVAASCGSGKRRGERGLGEGVMTSLPRCPGAEIPQYAIERRGP